MSVVSELQEAVAAVRERSGVRPEIAVVLGSGLGELASQVLEPVSVPYDAIPHFPVSTAPGHAGRLILGHLAQRPVVLMAGRAHMYEGYSAQEVVFGVRSMHALGARTLIITNAAGGVNLGYHSGTLMLISDHINLTGRNPLVGTNESGLGVRFPDMSEAYDPALRAGAHKVAQETGISVEEGVYLGLLGPSYETPAEVRMARLLGADAVGMSTVMEVIAASHLGMRVLGISCITNMASGVLPRKLTEEEVLETARSVQGDFVRLVVGIVRAIGASASA